MALSIEIPMNLPVLDRVLPGRAQARAEAGAALEQRKIDAIRLRDAALKRIPSEPDHNFPLPKTPYDLDTPTLGGRSSIIVDTKNPRGGNVKIRFPAKRPAERYTSIGTGTLNIDSDGFIQTTFLESERRPLPDKFMKDSDYEIGKESLPASLTHPEFISIANAISTEGTLMLSSAAASYQNALGAEIPSQDPSDVNTDNLVILHPPAQQNPAA